MFTCDDPLRFVGFLPLHDEGRGSERQIVEEEEVNKLCLRPGCFFFFRRDVRVTGPSVFCALYQTVPKPFRRAGIVDLSLSLRPVR